MPTRDDRNRLPLEKVSAVFQNISSFPTVREFVTVVWHAGEPLTLGPGYYEEAFETINRVCPPTLKILHSFQTNGMLINDAWCDLFSKWQVAVGVSIDGPKEVHDAYRKTRSGGGTFEKALAGISVLRRRSVPFHVISVLTKESLLAPDELFAFYQSQGIHDVGFNIDEQEGIYSSSSLSHVDDQGMVRFLSRFSDLIEETGYEISVRELEQTLAAIRYLDKDRPPLNDQTTPFGIISVDVHGDVYTYSPELIGYKTKEFPSFSIGNVYRDSFSKIASSSVLAEMDAQIAAGVSACAKGCDYFSICGGGAPSNKLFENGHFASTETMYCRLTKQRVTDFLLQKIELKVVERPDPKRQFAEAASVPELD